MPNADEPIPFGSLLRQSRIAAGLTQEALAERTGLGVRSIQHLEGGAHLPHRDTVDRLIRTLGLTGEERSRFERLAQPTPRPREAVPVPRVEVPGDDAQSRTPTHNLPAPLSSFVGREAEVAAIADLLRTARLVTLVGVGGCGKTRLALAVAERLRETYPQGVWLVELAPLTDPALLPKAVAVALGIQEEAQQPLRDTVTNFLRSRRLLLVLDNCEHLIAACARLADDLLRACPTLTVLATSREALGILGEVAWRVPSLTLPDRGRGSAAGPDPVARLLVAEAAQLFGQRAQTVEPGFTVITENAGAIAEICWRLDGLPLALELAAARIKVLSAEQIVARLDDRFQLLTGGSRTALPRQQTLRATLDWSHDLLSEPERALFRRLSVFAGGFTLEAAEAVSGAAGLPADAVLDLVSQLVDKSLVLVEKRGGEPRYRLLETVRQYGDERLVEAGEAAATWNRLVDWCAGLAEKADLGLRGPEQALWSARLEREHDNLRAALGWCRDRDPESGLRLAGGLRRFWAFRSHYAEGSRWLITFLERTQTRNARRANALHGAGILTFGHGDYQKARSLLEESVAIYRAIGAPRGAGMALVDLGLCLDMLGEPAPEVRAAWEESLALLRNDGDELGACTPLFFLGRLDVVEGYHARAQRLLEESLRMSRLHQDLGGEAGTLCVFALLYLARGDLRRAERAAVESRDIFRRLGSRHAIVWTSCILAMLIRSRGDLEHAQSLLLESLRLSVDMQHHGVYNTLVFLGDLAVDRGRHARGVRLIAAGETGRPAHSLRVVTGPRLHRYYFAREVDGEESLAIARSALGDEMFATARAEGEAMTREQAVAYALEDRDG